jgi:phospholipid transport system transporter-binding protein
MSEFELKRLDDGRFELHGAMSFETVDRILRQSEKLFGRYENVQVDCSGVSDADSAGLALLLEWRSQAFRQNGQIHFSGLPRSIVAIARTTEVDHLLG